MVRFSMKVNAHANAVMWWESTFESGAAQGKNDAASVTLRVRGQEICSG